MATMISGGRRSESLDWYDLTTERGLEIGVGLGDSGYASIYIQRYSCHRLALGKHFHADTPVEALVKARDAYKKPDVKAALSALLAHVTEQPVAA